MSGFGSTVKSSLLESQSVTATVSADSSGQSAADTAVSTESEWESRLIVVTAAPGAGLNQSSSIIGRTPGTTTGKAC